MPTQSSKAGAPGVSSQEALSPMKAARLLVALRIRRLWNILVSRSFFSKSSSEEGRAATPRKAVGSAIVSSFAALFIFGAILFQFYLIVETLERLVSDAELTHLLVAMLPLLCLLAFLAELGFLVKNLSQPDSDMEWLLTLPASISTIQWMKWVEKSITSTSIWGWVFPFLCVICWKAGHGWWSLLVAPVLLIPVASTVALAALIATTAARLILPAVFMRNFQAVATLLWTGGFFLVFSPVMQALEPVEDILLVRALDPFAGWIGWTPWGAPAQIVWSHNLQELAWVLGALTVGWGVSCALGWLVLSALNRRGSVVGKGVLRGKRKTQGDGEQSLRAHHPRGIVMREVLLIARDRKRLAEVFAPILLMLVPILFVPESISTLLTEPSQWMTGAFVVALFVLLTPTLRAISSEGEALWISYTLPVPLEDILAGKARLWSGVSVAIYVLAIALGAWWTQLEVSLLIGAVYGTVGIVFIAHIGVALSVFSSDPLAEDGMSQFALTKNVFLLYWLGSVYTMGLVLGNLWVALAVIVVMGSFAAALWQNLQRWIPYMLDPVATPEPRITLADGLLVALTFLVLQPLAMFILEDVIELELSVWPRLLSSFALAGAVSVVAALFVFWRRSVPELWRELGLTRGVGIGRSAAEGMVGGMVAATFGVTYIVASIAWPEFGRLTGLTHEAFYLVHVDALLWVGLLVVIAAPLFEEVIFRGMIFRGLRSSIGVRLSVLLSAGIFAIIHPSMSAVPVFFLGLVCAVVFARARSLIAPIVVHAFYNLAIVGVVAFMPPPPELLADQEGCADDVAASCEAMGRRFYDGRLVKQDVERSAHFHERACNLGSPAGCWRLGLLFDKGEGVELDYERASKLWEQACDDAFGRACHSLGHLYDGDLGEPEPETAFEWFARGCEYENEVSCRHVADAYLDGESVSEDPAAAQEFYARACELGDEESCSSLE